MAAARSMYYGRSKGLMARHSAQGSRLQAARTAKAQETARAHGNKGGGGRNRGGKKAGAGKSSQYAWGGGKKGSGGGAAAAGE